MSSAAIQFFGIDRVMEMFDARQVPAWSIWCGKDFINKGIGDGELRTFLEALNSGYNNPIYTLKVYEDINDAAKIKSNTPHDGSFNFKLQMPPEMMPGMGAMPQSNNGPLYALIKKIEALEAQIAERDEEEEKPDNTIGGFFTSLIKSPNDLITLVNVGRSLLGLPVQQVPNIPYTPAATMGAVSTDIDMTDQEKMERLANAIDTLEKNDAKIIEHLEQLAKIASTNPQQFKFLLTMLEGMK